MGNELSREQVAVAAIVALRDATHSEVEDIGTFFANTITPMVNSITDPNYTITDETLEQLKTVFAKLSAKFIEFTLAIEKIEAMADSALDAMDAHNASIAQIVVKDGKNQIIPLSKRAQRTSVKIPKMNFKKMGKS